MNKIRLIVLLLIVSCLLPVISCSGGYNVRFYAVSPDGQVLLDQTVKASQNKEITVPELTPPEGYISSGMITLTLPSLQFWTMIVIEPEAATTKDNTVYAPTTSGESLEPDITSTLASTTSNTRTWSLQLEDGIYEAHADIPSGTLTLQRDNEDAIILPLGGGREGLFTPSGLPATNSTRGILIGKGKKVLR